MITKIIIIAAGLGSRLMPLTKECPKTLVNIKNKSILAHQTQIYINLGLNNINLIVGYKKEKFKNLNYNYFINKDYRNNNVLASLFCAKKALKDTCLISYSDIIFKKNVVQKLLQSKSAISIVVDTNWKKNYTGRTQHPISQAENVIFNKKNNLIKIGKHLDKTESNGEFIGMLKLTDVGTKIFKKYYKKSLKHFRKKQFFNAKSFKKAYITDFLSFLIKNNINIKCVKIKNNWREIDTKQDLKNANTF